MNPEVLILCGLPCSGKSTFCSNYPHHLQLSSDKFIQEAANKLNKTYNEIYERTIKQANKFFFDEAQTAAKLNADVIIDRTNLTIKSRQKIIKIFKNHDPVIVYFDVPIEVIKSRNTRPGKIIADAVFDRMFATLQIPTIHEASIVTVKQLTRNQCA
jgi:predicted kinase